MDVILKLFPFFGSIILSYIITFFLDEKYEIFKKSNIKHDFNLERKIIVFFFLSLLIVKVTLIVLADYFAVPQYIEGIAVGIIFGICFLGMSKIDK